MARTIHDPSSRLTHDGGLTSTALCLALLLATGFAAAAGVDGDGTLKWKFKTAGIIASSPAVGRDGTIYIGGGDDFGARRNQRFSSQS